MKAALLLVIVLASGCLSPRSDPPSPQWSRDPSCATIPDGEHDPRFPGPYVLSGESFTMKGSSIVDGRRWETESTSTYVGIRNVTFRGVPLSVYVDQEAGRDISGADVLEWQTTSWSDACGSLKDVTLMRGVGAQGRVDLTTEEDFGDCSSEPTEFVAMHVGQEWTWHCRPLVLETRPHGAASAFIEDWSARARVVAEESVTVPAGTFAAFRVEWTPIGAEARGASTSWFSYEACGLLIRDEGEEGYVSEMTDFECRERELGLGFPWKAQALAKPPSGRLPTKTPA